MARVQRLGRIVLVARLLEAQVRRLGRVVQRHLDDVEPAAVDGLRAGRR